jgi:hypothetical protein
MDTNKTEWVEDGTALHKLCVLAVNEMVAEDIARHVSYISPEDEISFGLKAGGRIPKVTIEWVDEQEANPENFKVAQKE